MPTTNSFVYPALQVRQTSGSKPLVLFSAPATDIDQWAGVPQKEQLGEGHETVGFQREESANRIRELASFFAEPGNVIQNPLLAAARNFSQVEFRPIPTISPDASSIELGHVVITSENLKSLTLLELLAKAKSLLESRVPELAAASVPDDLLLALKERASEAIGPESAWNDDNDTSELGDPDLPEGDAEEDDLAPVLENETHILDFWQEIAARVSIIKEMNLDPGDGFLGFSKEAMVAILQPVVLVDGQHRLRGAIAAARAAADTPEARAEVERRVAASEPPNEVELDLIRSAARDLPVSLLMDDRPSEHVFQFVVVNQKATPIGNALLGTIVSTSLSSNELNTVSRRLTSAGIPLEKSQAIAFLSRNENSPFAGKVQRGLMGEDKDLLPWTVLGGLVEMFRYLRGGRLFGKRIDWANKWSRDYLQESALVAHEAEPYAAWSTVDGPWRDIFIHFWSSVRDRLADLHDEGAGNYWGSPRQSNLFNKVSLYILAADFFQYLCEKDQTISSPADIPGLVEDWLVGVNSNYFARDWRLTGVKKDSPGIRNQWAELWEEYRKDPLRLPDARNFRVSKAG